MLNHREILETEILRLNSLENNIDKSLNTLYKSLTENNINKSKQSIEKEISKHEIQRINIKRRQKSYNFALKYDIMKEDKRKKGED